MKKPNKNNQEEVRELLDEVTLTEAADQVWGRFDKALRTLDPQSEQILSQFFDGKTALQLSEDHGVPVRVMDAWIAKAKRELCMAVKEKLQIRQ